MLKRINRDNLYYYDDASIKETDVKEYLKNSNLNELSLIPKSSILGIYDIIKELAKPLSSVITPQIKTRESRKGKITFTDIIKNEVRTLEISEFEKRYLTPDKLVVFAKQKEDYLSRYSDWPFYHFKLTDTELNKLGLRSNLIHVTATRNWQKWLLENHKSFRKAFVWKLYYTYDIRDLIYKHYRKNNCIGNYLEKYNISYSGLRNVPLDLIFETPVLQKQIKIFKTCVKSLFDRDKPTLKFKKNDSND